MFCLMYHDKMFLTRKWVKTRWIWHYISWIPYQTDLTRLVIVTSQCLSQFSWFDTFVRSLTSEEDMNKRDLGQNSIYIFQWLWYRVVEITSFHRAFCILSNRLENAYMGDVMSVLLKHTKHSFTWPFHMQMHRCS